MRAAMSIQAVFLPMFVQVALTFALGFWAAGVRFAAVRSGAARVRDIALREPNWPKPVLQVLYAYQNQLELPLLFYLLTILAWMTKHADLLFVVLAWSFTGLRILHAGVHVTSNHMGRRALLFLAGAVLLAVMWAILIVRILLGL
jgi:hypothetical protein